ncbi:LIC_12616 family protein [Haemophilus sputorum]|uniref:phage neck terminator protein n=1 Tax=Haemophilus sputorum TaxID=1078480 RepID=UPI0028D48832|nr:hypothetical protein [Haemophilus sputorum]
MDTLTRSQFDIVQLRKLIQLALKLPDGVVIGGHLPQQSNSAFITVDVVFSTEIGQSKREFLTNEIEEIQSSLLSTVAISCYGKNAYSQALKIRNILQSSHLIDALRAMKAGIVRFSDVRNLTATIGADYEERGQFDCVISHAHIVQTNLKETHSVGVTGSISVDIKRPEF